MTDDIDIETAEAPQRYPLTVPHFEPSIPPFLSEKLSEQESFVINSLSTMEQRSEWMIRTLVELDRRQIESERLAALDRKRLILLQKSWIVFSAKKALISVPGFIALAALVAEFIKWLARHFISSQ